MPSLRLAKIDQLRLVGCLIFLVTSTINIMNEYQGIYLILTVFARVVVSLVHMKFNVDNKGIHLGIYHPIAPKVVVIIIVIRKEFII